LVNISTSLWIATGQLWNSYPDDIISADTLSTSGVISDSICSSSPVPVLFCYCSVQSFVPLSHF